ncbi:hypothetical protein CPLU01_13860 [Colletotrichum plurivorum]|uniref:AoPex11B n=1 Tax=Colletotrichum plurivorum TaxID=2175906 RepID=A0A8H6JP46_9PEZI|nr:hypothetical protein CPLU01_13860 [Colletotrichum plurivorum]
MTSFKFDQFVAFGSDSAGLERILRALQSLVVILLTYPSLLSFLSIPQAPGIAALLPLKSNLNLSRRAIRLFWFLNSFGTSYNLYTSSSSSSSPKPLETWLDIVRLTLLGLYAGIESATLLDLLGLPGVSVFGEEQTRRLNLEAQRFWILGLWIGIAGNLLRIVRAFAYAPVPQHGEGYGTGEGEKAAADGEKSAATVAGNEKTENGEEEKLDWEAERKRLRAIVVRRRQERKRWRAHVAGTVRSLGRRVVSDALDSLIPAAALGWFDIGAGAVAVAMLGSTWITSRDVWERCGALVAARRGA